APADRRAEARPAAAAVAEAARAGEPVNRAPALDSLRPLPEDRAGRASNMKSLLRFAVALAAVAAVPFAARAQSFPSHPVKFIVPFPAGGINDVLAHIAADKLQAKWGQPIIIEQKTGAGGNIGADLAAQAEPDGHTLFVAPPGPLAINQSLYKKLSYKPEDFVPITVLGSVPNVTIVKKDLPANSLKELVEHIRANPGK